MDPFTAQGRPGPSRSYSDGLAPLPAPRPAAVVPPPLGSSSSSSVEPVTFPSAMQAPLPMDRSPPLTPTPTPSSSFLANSSSSLSAARVRAISPPTPAPSPQPRPRQSKEGGAAGGSMTTSPFFDPTRMPPPPLSEPDLIEQLRAQVNALAPSSRQALLSLLMHDSTAADLSVILPLITPRLKRDFLKTLPLELAFHVLSFVDDAKTLARASAVSRFWRALLEDEATWKQMCWKSGFVPPASCTARSPSADDLFSPSFTSSFSPRGTSDLLSPTAPGFGNTGERLRTLEFGPRPSEEDDQLYTPAGRERRGTLDRTHLSEFAARAELFDLPSGSSAPPSLPPASAAMGLGLSDVGGTTAAAVAQTAGPASGLAARRGQRGVAPVAVSQPPAQAMAGYQGLGEAFAEVSLAASTSTAPASRQTVRSQQQQLVSPPLRAVPVNLPPLVVPASQSLHSHLSAHAASPTSSRPSHPLPSIPSFPPPPFASSSSSSARPAPFSYKRHFKLAYLTQDAWLHGPGRLLSTQMSADDGVVTSLGFDDEWIVVGMATSKVHVFEAATGGYVRTLEGHEQGVWCLTLVSKGGGPRDGDGAEEREMDGAEWDGIGKGKGRAAAFERPMASPMGTTFSQPGYPPASSSSGGGASLRPPRPNFFRDGSTTPLAASFHSFPNSPSHVLPPVTSSSSSTSSSSAPHQPRRRRSFPSTSSSFASPPRASPSPSSPAPGEAAGMGLGAGGPTGDSSQQSGVCGTARGWGQKGAVVVSGACDRDVRVWDVESGHCLHTLRGHTSTVRCMRVLDGRPVAVSGSRDKTVRVWDIENGECLHVLNGHQMSVRCLEVSGNKIVSGSYDATCRLWDADTGECYHVFRGHVHQIYAVAFDGIRVVTGSLDSTVRIWSAETGEFLALLQGHTSLVGQLQIDPVSNVLVTGGSDGRVLVFSLDTFEVKHALQAHENSVTCLQFDQTFIVTGSNDGKVKLWDFKTGQYVRSLADPCDAVWRVVFRDDKCVTLCRRNDRTLMDVRTFRPSEEELAGVSAGRVAGDGGTRS
ncbi:hypothetical protein JCM8097_008006 [Rhodosporidiobolus ruineniae]